MSSILFLVILGLIVWCWQNNLRHREHAIERCKAICEEMNLQLLDQTVALASVRLQRDRHKRFILQRRYRFEISQDGISRHSGYIVMRGFDVIHTEIDLPEGPVILQGEDLITYH